MIIFKKRNWVIESKPYPSDVGGYWMHVYNEKTCISDTPIFTKSLGILYDNPNNLPMWLREKLFEMWKHGYQSKSKNESLLPDNYYQIRNNWEGKGYRLYYGDDETVSQVHGELEGIVFYSIEQAKGYCKVKFNQKAFRVRG